MDKLTVLLDVTDSIIYIFSLEPEYLDHRPTTRLSTQTNSFNGVNSLFHVGKIVEQRDDREFSTGVSNIQIDFPVKSQHENKKAKEKNSLR